MAERWDELFRRARSRDAEAFEKLLERCFDAAWAVALGVTGVPAEAEDVCQDAFVRAWQRIDQCRDAEGFRGWLVAVVRSVALNRVAKARRRRVLPLDERMASPGPGPDRDAARAELRGRLQAAVARLGEAQRQVLLLHDLEGWRHAEIAQLLQMSEAMSRRHLCDARARMRHLLAVHATADRGARP